MWLTIICLGFVVLIACCTRDARLESQHDGRDMSRKISDEEFLAACSIDDADVALKVRRILSDHADIPEENIHPQDRLIQDLGMG